MIDPDAEITVECAPGQIADATLDALVAAGVNRVSLGVQSFIDREAQQSGRLHSRAIVLEDLKRLRAAGIANLNVDLIAGLADQTFASWQESVSVLVDSGVSHASIYMLEVDEDSRLGRELLSRRRALSRRPRPRRRHDCAHVRERNRQARCRRVAAV